MTYSEQLKHPKWQMKRLEVLNHYGAACAECADDETTLHVHHKSYVRGRMAWEYDLDNFLVLCADCHPRRHRLMDRLKLILAEMPSWEIETVLGYASATSSARSCTPSDCGYENDGVEYLEGFAKSLVTLPPTAVELAQDTLSKANMFRDTASDISRAIFEYSAPKRRKRAK